MHWGMKDIMFFFLFSFFVSRDGVGGLFDNPDLPAVRGHVCDAGKSPISFFFGVPE